MNTLYLWLNIGSISIPFIYSFHPRLQLYKKFHWLFISLMITMAVFIPWDVIFTINGIWGFNPDYFLNTKILSLPLEEWLFFICIPFACVFTHYALLLYFPKMKLGENSSKSIAVGLMLTLVFVLIFNYDKWYTLVNFSLAIPLTLIVLKYNPKLLQHFFLTFLVMLIPFFIVNGVLTGSWIENQVVWYNNAENLGIRMGTIPVEDSIYAYSMILMSLFFFELLSSRHISDQN
ncbi:MAG: lycopene cyclase domain-containing protein [Flavobacteriaceae bacterium]|nr:lycopene cyclase domain-containing protein [Flavobacteriaceae bacterium]MDG1057201.1 lycopene cyclase domain-containing protein [Flavobacteriaceae bacterium]